MAFNLTSQVPTTLEVVGSFVTAKWGITALVAGTATVTLNTNQVVQAVFTNAQSGNASFCTATTGNAFTITGTGTDAIMWLAICTGAA